MWCAVADDKELESLTDFVNSEGFRVFGERVTREWGPSGLRFQQAVREAAAGKEGAVANLQMVLKVQEEIIGLMTWPNDRVEALRNQTKARMGAALSMSRRGPGL